MKSTMMIRVYLDGGGLELVYECKEYQLWEGPRLQ